MKRKVVAPCGLDCFNCEFFEDNVTEELQAKMSQITKLPKEIISCKGCSEGNVCLFLKIQGKSCKTLECIKEKGVNYCYECDNFPCDYLMPLADGAANNLHNIKLYNLCRMKKIGIDAWIDEVNVTREKYFNKKFIIGEGGKLNVPNKDCRF